MKHSLDKTRRVPFYRQCAEALRRAIEDGTYKIDEYLPPERQLSEQLGVNRLTLRKGLLDLVRDGLIENIPGSGNRVVMTRIRAQKTRTLGCLMPRFEKAIALSPYYGEILDGIEEEAASNGYDLVFASVKAGDLWTADGQARKNPPTLKKAVDGLLLVGGLTDELAIAYDKKGVRLVLVDKEIEGRAIPSIMPDNEAGMATATQYLIGLGHRRIAFLSAPPDPVVEKRRAGFMKALGDAGLRLEPGDVIEGGYEVEPAYAATGAYLEARGRDLPTAIVAINDEAAIGAMKALQQKGLSVPKDLSVTGFDNTVLAEHSTPPLTTVNVPRKEMGRWAAQSLIGNLQKPQGAASRIVLKTDLVIRQSVTGVR